MQSRISKLGLVFMASLNLSSLAHADTSTLEQAKALVDSGHAIEAAAMFTDLAKQGEAKAQYNLGLMYLYGDGVKQDYQQAINWLRLSANQGFTEAQYQLAVIYFTNKITPPNYAESLRLYRLAAEHGHVRSQLNLGMIYLKGEVTAQDYAEANLWLNTAAANGNSEAQFDLGNMYLYGEGVPKDVVLSYMWVAIAAEDTQASVSNLHKRQNMLRFLTFNMSADELARAKELITACHQKQLKSC
jgi:uncharacterized protein